MATLKIPLNKFVSRNISLVSSPELTNIYPAPERRASIIISAQVSNQTISTRTITFGISSGENFFPLVNDFEVPPNDARAIVSGRVVIRGVDNIDVFVPDFLVVRDSTQDTTTFGLTGLTLSLGILETINVD